MMTFAKCRLF